MRFNWRQSEQSPAERLVGYLGVVEDLDKTPVAMFAQANGRELGLTMEDLGELVENHNQILFEGSSVMPDAERNAIAAERQLAYKGATEMARHFNLLLDDRLRPYEPRREKQPGPAEAVEFAQLMQRVTARGLRKD